MPIMHVRQPEFLPVGDNLRLRRLDGSVDFGRDWRRDLQALLLEDGGASLNAFEDLRQLYARLNDRMEVYGMEARSGSGFSPVGVAAFCQENMLVFIGDRHNRQAGNGEAGGLGIPPAGPLLGLWVFGGARAFPVRRCRPAAVGEPWFSPPACRRR